jgi:hypothetical protein
MKRILIAASVASALFAAPAFADCAGDMNKITDAMKTMKMDEAGTTKANELMDKAKKAGDIKDEAACTSATTELMTMLGLKT